MSSIRIDIEQLFASGRHTFMGVELIVERGSLIPRAETELLGHTALELMQGIHAPQIIDMCCGSGNLACALGHHLPTSQVWAADLTDDCVSLARKNTEHVGVSERVQVAQGDLFAPLDSLREWADCIVCNPPYISSQRLSEGDRSELLDFEPREAFDGGPYGLSIHQRVLREALSYLRPGGHLLFEIGQGQDRQIQALFKRVRAYDNIRLVEDAEGHSRVAVARKPVPQESVE